MSISRLLDKSQMIDIVSQKCPQAPWRAPAINIPQSARATSVTLGEIHNYSVTGAHAAELFGNHANIIMFRETSGWKMARE